MARVWCLMVNINFHSGKDENINRSKDKETWGVSDTTSHNPWEMRLVADSWMTADGWSLHPFMHDSYFVSDSDSARQRLGKLATLGSGLGHWAQTWPRLRHRGHTGTALILWWRRCHRGENELSRYRLLVVINHRPSSLTIHGPDLYLIKPITNIVQGHGTTKYIIYHFTVWHKITVLLRSHFTGCSLIRCISCNLWDSGICLLCSARLQLRWPAPSLCNNCKRIINCCLRNLFNILLPRDEENEIDDVSWDTNWTEFLKDEIQNVAEVDWSAHRGQADQQLKRENVQKIWDWYSPNFLFTWILATNPTLIKASSNINE